jgi:hypothetical protein
MFAGLLVFSVFVIGVAGIGLARFGPCAASNPAALLFSGALSAAAIYSPIQFSHVGNGDFDYAP